ncbi:phospholipase carboxylesterase [Diplodia corticola]|uniref:Phospholipase carboxylesterase n=1 Tax=Diplodia corticola TaxID=236234 RepID=A0A1J9QRZ5_9PEZI|nr:phospholipase carboxylesterase [Diplodia corticola]OJD31193.1 phospholipase carboxylesterase [Diplodia corticola]
MQTTDTVIIPPSSPHTHTIIFLHGRDSLPSAFSSELFESQASDTSRSTLPQLLPHFKWVFPAAGLRPAKRFGGVEMSQWFDIWSVEEPTAEGELQSVGLEESVGEVLRVVEREVGILGGRRERVVLAGISMGCATGVAALVRGGGMGCVGAFVGVSGWMPVLGGPAAALAMGKGGKEEGGGEDREGRGDAGVLEMPVLLEHCVDDDVVPVRNGEVLRDGLVRLGMDVEWHAYEDGGHWMNEPHGIDDLVAFLKRVL